MGNRRGTMDHGACRLGCSGVVAYVDTLVVFVELLHRTAEDVYLGMFLQIAFLKLEAAGVRAVVAVHAGNECSAGLFQTLIERIGESHVLFVDDHFKG